MRRWRASVVAAVAATTLGLVGCSSPSEPTTAGSGGSTTSSGPVTLTYWDWTPGMEKVVAEWNAANPGIQVNFTKVAGQEAPTKFLTAIKAGSGAPDIMLTEFQSIPTFVAQGALADISKSVDPSLKSQFSDASWNQVTLGTGAVYAVPQNSGLMMFYYRADVFDKYKLSVPKTWAEYADTARKLHKADPKSYLGTFSAGDPGWFVGLSQQAGASWWGVENGKWSVNVDQTGTQKVADFWGGLVQEGVIDNKPFFTPAFNQSLTDGTLAGWISGAWAGAIFIGSAPDAAGKWKVAPLPQWDAAAPGDGTWGGAGLGVSSQSKHPAEAAKFIQWVNASQPGLTSLLKATGGLFPSDMTNGPKVLTEPPAYFKDQTDFWTVVSGQASTLKPFTYGPNADLAYSAFTDAFGKAAEARTSTAFVDAVKTVNKTTVDDLAAKGFSK
jgi:multiple sugar transport system substrate-binding protein